MSTLHDRLEELADGAPRGESSPADVWAGGVRRARARRAGVAAVAAAVVVALVGAGLLLRPGPPAPVPADVPSFEELRLPQVVHAPGEWLDDEGPRGPLAAVAMTFRNTPVGLTRERRGHQLFGVSAVDGSTAWIDLPGADADDRDLVGWFALSPDGRWIGWTRHARPGPGADGASLLGWGLMDTVTGRVRELTDPVHPRLRDSMAELAFSGDSRYLLASFETPDAPPRKGHQFVAWDVEDGSRTVLEGPGHRWLPTLGSAPTGVVWSRGRTVLRADPASGERASYTLPQDPVAASWGPDDRAFAFIGHPEGDPGGPWRLHAGPSLEEAARLPLDVHPSQLLGWRDERHVVVGHHRSTVRIVDVVTGEVTRHRTAGDGELLSPLLLAEDLWQNPLRPPKPREGLTDPRRPYRWGAGALLAVVAMVGGTLVWRRRRRSRGGPHA